jgi:hypothetical protein
MRFTVSIENTREDSFSTRHFDLELAVGGEEVDQIYDDQNKVVARSEERLTPGASTRFDVGFWVPDEGALVMTVSPGYGYESVDVQAGG